MNTKSKFDQPLSKKNCAGFTLIELLVVIAIIGILAGIIMVSLNNARAKARDAKRVGDVRQMATAMEQYHIHNGFYPTGTASVASVGTGVLLSDPAAMDQAVEPVVPNYIPTIPEAPSPADGDCLGDAGRGNNNYWYDSADDGSTYTITYCIGKEVGELPAGVHSATPNGIQ